MTTNSDGNCFFSAVLHGLAARGDLHFPWYDLGASEAENEQRLRTNSVNYLRHNLDTVAPQTDLTFNELIQMEIATPTSVWRNVSQFLNSMETQGTWAELPVILAASALLQIPIQIVSSSNTGDPARAATYGEAAAGNEVDPLIVFSLHNSHFFAAVPHGTTRATHTHNEWVEIKVSKYFFVSHVTQFFTNLML